jgi:hypothetical protein
LIETEKQRRWWFATHPEFSSSAKGQRRNPHDSEEGGDSGRPSPEDVDASVDERLKYETDNIIIALLEGYKKWFGTEFQSKTPEEKHALLWENEESPLGGSLIAVHPAADPASYDKYEDALDRIETLQRDDPAREAFIREMMDAGWSRDRAQERWEVYKLNESVARGVATAMTVHSAIVGARAILTGAYRWAVALGEAGAIGKSGGPGKWVEVARSFRGLEHQSKMSGQPIIVRDGKYYIKEYELNGVKFDDYKYEELYEYKGPQGNLVNRKTNEFYECINTLHDDALRQSEAAQGIPVIWRVGADQVDAFRKAVGKVPGIIIIP